MTFQKYQLHALTAELWRIHDEQDCKLGSYLWLMSCILQGSAMSKLYIRVIDQEWGQDGWILGSISAALPCQVRSAGSSSEQRLEIEPSWILAKYFFCVFKDRDEVGIHKLLKKNEATIQRSWPNKLSQ